MSRGRVTTPWSANSYILLLGIVLVYLCVVIFHTNVVRDIRGSETVSLMSNLPTNTGTLDGSLNGTNVPRAVELPRDPSKLEVWARDHRFPLFDKLNANKAAGYLSSQELEDLHKLCGRCMYNSLIHSVQVHGTGGEFVFVTTGDIIDEWIRDSSVQLGVLLPKVEQRRTLRRVIDGAIETQAFLILQDPWANSYTSKWRDVSKVTRFEQLIGRGGWVASRNFELDSGAYFLNLIWNYFHTPSVWNPAELLNSTFVHDAIMVMLNVWEIEQQHEDLSPYRYSELPRDGKGPKVNNTGMIWTGFRPSDDPAKYGYNIPANMYAAGALQRIVQLNKAMWRDDELGFKADRLAKTVREGIENHGVVIRDGVKVYAYEVNGLGDILADFEDPNLPSLMAMPLLGYPYYDVEVYRHTRNRLLSSSNPYFYKGKAFSGLGSTHTPQNYIWPLGHITMALTTDDPKQQADVVRDLLQMQCGNGLMHESVDVNNPGACTRPIFEWSNAMLVVLAENVFHLDCDKAARLHWLEEIQKLSTSKGNGAGPTNGGKDDPLYYMTMEGMIQHME